MSSLAQRVYRLNPMADRVALGYCRRLPRHVDRDDIRHLAQVEAWRAEQEFNGSGSLAGWIAQYVNWRLLDVSRADTPHATHLDIDDEAIELPDADEELDPAAIVERSDTYSKALHALPPVTRNVVERTLAGATGVQIAQEFGVDPSRIWQHLSAAKRVFSEQHS